MKLTTAATAYRDATKQYLTLVEQFFRYGEVTSKESKRMEKAFDKMQRAGKVLDEAIVDAENEATEKGQRS